MSNPDMEDVTLLLVRDPLFLVVGDLWECACGVEHKVWAECGAVGCRYCLQSALFVNEGDV